MNAFETANDFLTWNYTMMALHLQEKSKCKTN